jgi:hypothetical protein
LQTLPAISPRAVHRAEHGFDRGKFDVRVHASPHFVRPSASWVRMNASALAQVVCHEVPSPTKRQSLGRKAR